MSRRGTTVFKMEVGYYYRKYVKNLLGKMYGKIEVELEDTFLEVRAWDGFFKGVVIRVEPSVYEIYKIDRDYEEDKIYQWFGGSLKVVQGQRLCDTEEEYQLLISKVITPLQEIVEQLEAQGESLVYIGEEDIQRRTGIRLGEHERLVRVVKRFGEGIEQITGQKVTLHEYDYFSRQHYLGLGTVSMVIGGGKRIIQYNLPKKHIGVYTREGEEVSKEDNLGQVARNVYKIRNFTEFDKSRLKDGGISLE